MADLSGSATRIGHKETEGERDWKSLSPPPSDGCTNSPPGVDPSPRETVDRFLQDARARADLAAWIAEQLSLAEKFRWVGDWAAELVFSKTITTDELKAFIGQAKAVAANCETPAGAVFVKRVKKHLGRERDGSGQTEEAPDPEPERQEDAARAAAPAEHVATTDRPTAPPRKHDKGERTVWSNATEEENAAHRLALDWVEKHIAFVPPANGKHTAEQVESGRAAVRDALNEMKRIAAEKALNPES